jgi:osmotically-inducible protein OsmY
MKTDSQLLRDTQEQLQWEPSVREKEIGVAAKNGVLTLSGHVPSYADKYAAVRAVERVVGVKGVADEIVVTIPSADARTDTELAHQAVNALKWDVHVPDERIRVTVRRGWLTLEGDVDWQYQRTAAECAVRNLTGVQGVIDSITVKQEHVPEADVSRKIREALRRSADREADRISVETHDGSVTLEGTVRTFTERRDVERAAWGTAGVTRVEDRTVVGV